MRAVIITLALSLSCNAVVAQDADCELLAERMQAAYSNFPKINADTAVELVTWRASCAETPPDGPGNVDALCEVGTADGGTVFYWMKSQEGGQSSGFQMCLY